MRMKKEAQILHERDMNDQRTESQNPFTRTSRMRQIEKKLSFYKYIRIAR